MATEKVTIDRARPDDAAGISKVQIDSWLTTYPNQELGITKAAIQDRLKKTPLTQRIELWRQRILDPEVAIWIAKAGDRVVGWISVQTNPQVELAIYLLDEYHGQGLGSRLMAEALAWLGHNLDVYLTVATYNHKAIGLYKKFGFKITHQVEDQQAKRLKAVVIPQFEMVLRGKR